MNEREQDPVVGNNPDTATPVHETPVVTPESEATPAAPVVDQQNPEPVAPYVAPDSSMNAGAESVVTSPANFNIKAYLGVVLAILIIGAGLIFVLEKDGRISTGLFSGIINNMESSKPVATVNDSPILKKDFDSSVSQLLDIQATQGADVSDPLVVEQIEAQAIETLVNAELLRQAAIDEGIEVSQEQIDTRFNEISEGLGGADALAARMAEFNVTEESLRRDIENEFLIQGLFEVKIPSDNINVTEEEIAALYEQVGGSEAGLPPLEEVSAQIEQQITLTKEQEIITEYIGTLREEAEVEILL